MKKVLITGASSGIGKALYDSYNALPGYQPIGLSKRGPDIKMDITSDLESRLKATEFTGEGVDIIINCAGIMPLDENWSEAEIMDINFWAALSLMEIASGEWDLLDKTDTLFINIASISALSPDEDLPIYAASKAALLAATSAYAKKNAKYGRRFNCISPGFFDTNLVPGPLPENLLKTIPMGREGKPIELFDVVHMLEICKYITGSNIIVDGGLLCRMT